MNSKSISSLEHIDRRIIYASLVIIMALAILNHLTVGQMISLATMLLILFIVLGNIGYLYSRRR